MAQENVAYDPSLLQEFANRLYAEAKSIIVGSTLRGLFVGGFFGVLLGGFIQFAIYQSDKTLYSNFAQPSLELVGIVTVLVALVGAVSGYYSGREKAFKLMLVAQIALCQAKIEKNTSIIAHRN